MKYVILITSVIVALFIITIICILKLAKKTDEEILYELEKKY